MPTKKQMSLMRESDFEYSHDIKTKRQKEKQLFHVYGKWVWAYDEDGAKKCAADIIRSDQWVR